MTFSTRHHLFSPCGESTDEWKREMLPTGFNSRHVVLSHIRVQKQ